MTTEAVRHNPDFSHLVPLDGNGYIRGQDVAKNVRKHLKHLHPGVKFGVRSDHNSIDVVVPATWSRAQARELNEALDRLFAEGHFDGMTDSYAWNTTAFHKVFGGVQYLFVRGGS